MTNDFLIWLENAKSRALAQHQRKLVVLAGDFDWALGLLSSIPSWPSRKTIQSKQLNNWQIYSDNDVLAGTVNRQTYQFKLGTENQYVLFFIDNFNIDAFAALSGTLVAGGICFIVCPSSSQLPILNAKSPFLQRFLNKITDDDNHAIIQQSDVVLPALYGEIKQTAQFSRLTYGCITREQNEAVDKIIKVVKGHRNRPLVLTADRGRGKSSALAIACSELLGNLYSKGQQALNIVITAPHQQCLNIFFKQLQFNLVNATFHDNHVVHENGTIRFVAIDQLINKDQAAGLVLVDEAAALPVYLLESLAHRYHRIVFSSTVHGYEGAGRSFTLKFQKKLTKICPQWQAFHINEPIRWSIDDPLESFIFDSCLLDAKLPQLTEQARSYQITMLECCEISTAQLMSDEALLSQVFAVLVTAHYQTSPSDVELLLDNENVSLLVLKANKQIAAVALIINEGGVSDVELSSVKGNKRRLRDQFIPQSLLTHCGIEESFSYQYLRIMRIAVHPELQGRGIGKKLLAELTSHAKAKGVEFIGSSFGCNPQLLNFWLNGEYKLARIGFSRDKASGEYSALVLKSVNNKGNKLLDVIEQQFYRTFDYLLADEYRYLSTKLIWQIMHYCPTKYLPKLNEQDLQCVDDFSSTRRQYSCCVYGIHRWLLHQMLKPYDLSYAILINKVLQKHTTEELCHKYDFTGKKALNRYLVEWVSAKA